MTNRFTEQLQTLSIKAREKFFGKPDNNWVEQEHVLLHGMTTLETETRALMGSTVEAIGGAALMTPVALLMSPVALLRLAGLGEAMHSGVQVDFHGVDYSHLNTVEPNQTKMLYLAPDAQQLDRLYVDDPNSKDHSYFLLEGDGQNAITLDATEVVPGFGLHDVDRTRFVQYELQPAGSNPNNPEYSSNLLLESVAGRLTQEGMTILPTNMTDITFEDTALVPVNSLLVGRRGGMHNAVVGSAHVVFGVTEAGQAVAVFGADEQGNLTGMQTGSEGLGIMLLKWGEHGTEFESVLGIELDTGFYPLISADGTSVYYPDQETESPGAVKNASLVPAFVSEYQSPELVALRDQLNDSSDGRYAIEDGGGIWDSQNKSLVSGVSVDRNGSVYITVDGKEVDLGNITIQANSEGKLIVGDYIEGKDGWEISKTFTLCSFSEFKSCPVPLVDIPAKQQFVRRQVGLEMFDLDNLKYLKMNVLRSSDQSFMVPDVTTAPNYAGADSLRAPFIKDNEFNGVTVIDGVKYANINVPYVVELKDGGHKIVVLTGLSEMTGGDGYDNVAIGYFNDRMNVVPWRVDDASIDLATQFINPATGRNFTESEVKGIFEEMKQGDFNRADGLVLFFEIARSQKGWFE